MEDLQEQETSLGRVFKIDGSFVAIENIKDAELFELVKIGQDKLLGEIIKLEGDKAYVQCYEDTSSLSVGDPTILTKSPLSVELGPGIFTQIFDGIQRPLQEITEGLSSSYIPKNVNILGLDQDRVWEFKPSSTIKIDSIISGGDIYGSVFENNVFEEHNILASPSVQGRVTYIAPAGYYTLQDKVLEVELNEKKYQYGMSHVWPVRQPRPILEKLDINTPIITGIRVLDGFFPAFLGETCCISGPAECGYLEISLALTKQSNTQCMIYIGCAESGNEMASVLSEYPELKIELKDKEESVNQRTCLVANPSQKSLGKRYASLYAGTTFAEYFRDMGYNVGLIADQTSKWVETQTEISNRIGEILQEQEYPTFLASKLSPIYQRAGRVKCRGSPNREGSITLFGVVSTEDFKDPITIATLMNTKVFWGLDYQLKIKKHFPAVNWEISYSDQNSDPYFNEIDPDFLQLRNKLKNILKEQSILSEVTADVKPEQLSIDQTLTMEIAKIIREDFLFQNFYCDYDYNCPLLKTIGMMRCIVLFYECAKSSLSEDGSLKWDELQNQTWCEFTNLSRMKFLDPKSSKQQIDDYFIQFTDQINLAFQNLSNK
ncbi:unnamed protein product (macronuclear) [Paramecium tetraurelia]|uniref:H(+)-transporting two-sector ATPase n=1 Tax=Paramecium tetraurelia TaxID=5888 RepID=A0D9M8_PARTE|nr:uncharacterized protein GSPATT00014675001 [Paramecium tetraurelia]CAK79745.1 unnamed protein product [Paramecium tetraurelia]|eukprot:XP_001447142.1 hypothetical protein (macronuclear) [Paramecium tetraurelia strain d4-2]